MAGRLLRLRLFLEGQEVPVVSANVHAAVGSPATASIQVIATDRLLRLKPRTLVHLFFFDSDDTSSILESQTDGPDVLTARANIRYKLLFAGELANIEMSRYVGSRSAVLQCVDFTSYWSQARVYFKEMFSLSSEQGRTASFVEASVRTYDSWFGSPSGELIKALLSRPVTHKDMTGLLGGVVHLMELIGGVYKGKEGQFRGINDFFNVAELRLHLMQMIGALEKDDSSAELMQTAQHRSYLSRLIQQMGALASFRDVIDATLQMVRHRTAPNPAAFFVGTSKVKEKAVVDLKPSASDQAALRRAAAHIRDAAGHARTMEAWLHTAASPPDLHNTGFSRPREDIRTSMHLARIILSSMRLAPIVALNAEIGMNMLIQLLVEPSRMAASDLEPEAVRHARWADDMADRLENITLGRETIAKERDKAPRLYSTLLLPDVWFVPPPRCNVFFPELYSNFSYSRNFLGEITRLQLTTSAEFLPVETSGIALPSWGTVKQVYNAPKLSTKAKETEEGKQTFPVRGLLPHEVYTGIVPHFEHAGSLKQMTIKDKAAKGEKIDYAQRLANFLFFRTRFSARSITLQGIFNPYVVAGLPGLVIDRFVTAEQAELYRTLGLEEAATIEKKTGLAAPTQYLGMVSSVAHNISQEGGQTVVAMSQARTHNEDDEYLGADTKKVSRTVAIAKNPPIVQEKIAEARVAIQQGVLARGGGADLRTREAIGRAHVAIQEALSHNKLSRVKTSCTKAQAALHSVTTSGTLDTAFQLLGQAEDHLATVAGLTSGSVTVTEEKRVPPEKLLRPPWLSPIWGNDTIGKQVFEPLLGIGAITDALDVRLTEEDALLATSLMLEQVAEDGKQRFVVGQDQPDGVSIEEAVDHLVRTYAYTKMENGASAVEFVRQYHQRPIATIDDILGGAAFEIFRPDKGFHQDAYGDVDPMEGLLDGQWPPSSKSGPKAKVGGNMDPRRGRYVAVQEYVAELQAGTVLRG